MAETLLITYLVGWVSAFMAYYPDTITNHRRLGRRETTRRQAYIAAVAALLWPLTILSNLLDKVL